MTNTNTQQTMKIVLLGDGGVGKTTMVKRHLTGNFETKYVSTVGCEVHPLVWNTNQGKITMNLWDTAGQELLSGFREAYNMQADAFIVFFDVTHKGSWKEVPSWITNIQKSNPSALIIVVGNKADSDHRVVKLSDILDAKLGVPYYDISVKSRYNYEKPFMFALQNKFGSDLKMINQ
jgi:GTP-binding nuclear protein Ran